MHATKAVRQQAKIPMTLHPRHGFVEKYLGQNKRFPIIRYFYEVAASSSFVGAVYCLAGSQSITGGGVFRKETW